MKEAIKIQLLPHAEKLLPQNPFGTDVTGDLLLYHQWRTYEALQTHPLVINTYNTGTGKTRAALLRLLDPAARGANLLFIAPTNELIAQHARDVKVFCDRAKLDYHVIHVDAETLRGLPTPHENERVGEKLVRLFQNPRDYGWDGRKPLIVVTNPDIFYYAMYFSAYNRHDRRNLFEQFMLKFNYVVIDEFHYYNPKQLAAFLFYFALCKEFGYFDQNRKICLLSATPEPEVMEYLQRVFDANEIAAISPHNEPVESTDFLRTPTLAPVSLTLCREVIDEFFGSEQSQDILSQALAQKKDGAIISNALWRINIAHAALSTKFRGLMGRITGAERVENRRTAPQFPLILATPTVDIGYNFDKPGKTRQPLDFVIFDARTRDQLLQRLGRAGRVLGRSDTQTPSDATALINIRDEVWMALQELDGQTIDRPNFAQTINQLVPARGDFYSYMHSYGMKETLRPLFAIQQTLRPDLEHWLKALFDGVRDVFAPGNERWSYASIKGVMRHFEALESVMREKDSAKQTKMLTPFVSDYVAWKKWSISTEQFSQLSRNVSTNSPARAAVYEWVEAQFALESAIFNFREALQTPNACVFDSHRLLAESDVTLYDAIHIAANFDIEWFADQAEFESRMQVRASKANLFGRIIGYRSPRLRMSFWLNAPNHIDREEFEKVYCKRPVALKGLKIRAEAVGVKNVVVPLATMVGRAFEDQYVPVLLIPRNTLECGVLYSRLRDSSLFIQPVTVHFHNGSQADFAALIGSSVFAVHAELEGFLFALERKNDFQTIIL